MDEVDGVREAALGGGPGLLVLRRVAAEREDVAEALVLTVRDKNIYRFYLLSLIDFQNS